MYMIHVRMLKDRSRPMSSAVPLLSRVATLGQVPVEHSLRPWPALASLISRRQTARDGIQHVCAHQNADEAVVSIFVCADSLTLGEQTAVELCRRTLDAEHALVQWTLAASATGFVVEYHNKDLSGRFGSPPVQDTPDPWIHELPSRHDGYSNEQHVSWRFR